MFDGLWIDLRRRSKGQHRKKRCKRGPSRSDQWM